MDLKEFFRRYEHPFDFVIDTVKEIRRLKSVYNLSSKPVDNTFIYIRNDEAKLGLALNSAFDIARLCQVKNLYVNYVDETDEQNNLCFRFEENKQVELYFGNVPNSSTLKLEYA
jgi:hypothetical protein